MFLRVLHFSQIFKILCTFWPATSTSVLVLLSGAEPECMRLRSITAVGFASAVPKREKHQSVQSVESSITCVCSELTFQDALHETAQASSRTNLGVVTIITTSTTAAVGGRLHHPNFASTCRDDGSRRHGGVAFKRSKVCSRRPNNEMSGNDIVACLTTAFACFCFSHFRCCISMFLRGD